jgi:hypothetical protein
MNNPYTLLQTEIDATDFMENNMRTAYKFGMIDYIPS